jgi:hypothetical protein
MTNPLPAWDERVVPKTVRDLVRPTNIPGEMFGQNTIPKATPVQWELDIPGRANL